MHKALLLVLLCVCLHGANANNIFERVDWCQLLEHSDEKLFQLGVSRSIAQYCFVDLETGDSETSFLNRNTCEFSVKGKPTGTGGGIPLARNNAGSGCVYQAKQECDVLSSSSEECPYLHEMYDLTDQEREAMCTSSIVKNAAAQLRYGIQNGYCTDNPEDRCVTNSSQPVPTTAPTKNEFTTTPTITPQDGNVSLFDPLGPIPHLFRLESGRLSGFSLNHNGTRLVAGMGNPHTTFQVLELLVDENSTWQEMPSNSSESFFYDTAMSGDGTHLVGLAKRKGNFLVVYQFNGTEWSLKSQLSFPIERKDAAGQFVKQDLILIKPGRREIDTTYKLMAISESGHRVAASVGIWHWNGFEWVVPQHHRGIVVYEWNGTDYTQLGEAIFVIDWITSLQMDSAGNNLYLKRMQYTFNSDTLAWEVIDKNLPIGLVSPSGSRVASKSYETNSVTIYERDDMISFQWKEIANITDSFESSPSSQGSLANLMRFGYWMSWSEDGTRLLITDPSFEKPRDPGQTEFQGAVYLYQENGCTLDIGDAIVCPFLLLGQVPCSAGTLCGFVAELSADGKRLFHATRVDRGWTLEAHEVVSMGATMDRAKDERREELVEGPSTPAFGESPAPSFSVTGITKTPALSIGGTAAPSGAGTVSSSDSVPPRPSGPSATPLNDQAEKDDTSGVDPESSATSSAPHPTTSGPTMTPGSPSATPTTAGPATGSPTSAVPTTTGPTVTPGSPSAAPWFLGTANMAVALSWLLQAMAVVCLL